MVDRWDLVFRLIQAEEIARSIKEGLDESLRPFLEQITRAVTRAPGVITAIPEVIRERIERPPAITPQPAIRRIDERNYRVGVSKSILDKTGFGNVRQVLIISPSQNFNLDVYVDGETVYSGTYDDYLEIAPGSSFVSAYGSGGLYKISIAEITFYSSVRIILSNPLGEVIYKRVWIIYAMVEM